MSVVITNAGKHENRGKPSHFPALKTRIYWYELLKPEFSGLKNGAVATCIFRQISCFISETIQDSVIVAVECH